MDVVLALVLGLVAGLLVACAGYARDLRRIAGFLRGRNRASNARVTLGASAPGLRELADAVNAELDDAADARAAAVRHEGEFRRDLSALSHDIRTPLMGAKGYLQLAAGEAGRERRAELLGRAARRLDDTEALLDQLFAYAKASDPDLKLRMGPVALQPLVADVLVGHYPEFEALGWEPEVAFSDEGARVEADAEQLRRILENLVSNALRYGAAAPRLAQRAGDDMVTLEVANAVRDPGALDVSRLFDRFYQADSARGQGGVGLGLSTAGKLADAMGMRIGAELRGSELVIALVMERAAGGA